ncbi:hypothetical protein MHZ92_03265 [Sporosarcina sp. ACRSL]|uniref:hypothetical protein n=1 Tax=Sporosarcina sp. ACRSL TaxID=2918215 RepID=UPI001EF54815|nr:hypothetical protein [Sporosarcina sp. ACRSL]MCG7343137.1 hypothetical protein [Sporosarcina sp. ACRSL]
MADDKRKRVDTDEEVRAASLGAFSGDRLLSALDPFGTAAVTSSDKAIGNKAEDGDINDDVDQSERIRDRQ